MTDRLPPDPTTPDYRNEWTISGRILTSDSRSYPSGPEVIWRTRLLLSVRTALDSDNARVDALPIVVWHPAREVIEAAVGQWVTASGSTRRRQWTDADGRHSQIIFEAEEVTVHPLPEAPDDPQAARPDCPDAEAADEAARIS